MKTKHKALIITALISMAVIVIGLTVGIVLVATRAQATAFLTVTYVSRNVDCTITASGIVNDNESGNKTILLQDADGNYTLESKTITHAYGTDASMDEFEFEHNVLPADGEIEYSFSITDTTDKLDAKANKGLQVKVVLVEITENGDYSNVYYNLHADADFRYGADNNSSVMYFTMDKPADTDGAPKNTIGITFGVSDISKDVADLEYRIEIHVSYEIEDYPQD